MKESKSKKQNDTNHQKQEKGQQSLQTTDPEPQKNALIYLLNKYDVKSSNYLHQLDSQFCSFILFPFAKMFNPHFIIFPIIFIAFYSYYHAILDLRDSIIFASFYLIICIPLNLIVTLVTKKLFQRKRPHFNSNLKNKTSSIRGLEHNNSLPSGDAMQASNFLTNMHFLLTKSKFSTYYLQQFLPYSIILQLGVNTARVYFMCHFIGDTILGTIIGEIITSRAHIFLYSIYYECINELLPQFEI